MRTLLIRCASFALCLLAAMPVWTQSIPAQPTPNHTGMFETTQKPMTSLMPQAPVPPDTRTPEERCKAEGDEATRLKMKAEGPDLKVYLAQVSKITESNWKPLIPKEVDNPFYKVGEVKVCFALLPNG